MIWNAIYKSFGRDYCTSRFAVASQLVDRRGSQQLDGAALQLCKGRVHTAPRLPITALVLHHADIHGTGSVDGFHHTQHGDLIGRQHQLKATAQTTACANKSRPDQLPENLQ